MTLFAFLWALSLPHHPVLVPQPKPLALLTSGHHPAIYPQTQDKVAPPPLTYSPLRSQVAAYSPLELKPQLRWPAIATVDWHQWSATAAVAVVAQDKTAHTSGDATRASLAAGPCGSFSPAGGASRTAGFTIRVKNIPIGQVPSRRVADQVASQIRQAVPLLEANPDGLTPSLGTDQVAGQVDGKPVFVLPTLASGPTNQQPDSQAALRTTQWVNNLRLAFGGTPLDPSQVQMVSQGLGETHQTFNGTASWYGPYFHGRQTATGETFNQHDLTAAHKTLPFGTYLKVRNQLNGKSVVVRINDRGPYIGDRSLDLSYAAAQCLGSTQPGVIPYQATILVHGLPQAWRADAVATLP